MITDTNITLGAHAARRGLLEVRALHLVSARFADVHPDAGAEENADEREDGRAPPDKSESHSISSWIVFFGIKVKC